MENPASIILGTNYLYKYIKNEFYNSKIVFKINLVIILIIHLFIGYQLFYENVIISFFDFKLGYVLFIFYSAYTYIPLDMVLVEFRIWKKSSLNTTYLNTSKQLNESSKKKYFKPDKLTKLQVEVSNITEKQDTFIEKTEFEPVRELTHQNISEIEKLNKKTSNNIDSINLIEDDLVTLKKEAKTSDKRIDDNTIKIEDHLLKKEKLKISNGFTQSKIEIILNTFKNLFPNINTNHFCDFAFTKKTETFKGELTQTELKKFIEFLKTLQLNKVVGKNKTLLSKTIKYYFHLSEGHDTIYRWINKKEYSLINEKSIKQIESYIRKTK